MRRLSSMVILLAILLSFNSCKPETVESAKKLSIEKDFDLVKVKGNYEIKVLDYMTSTDILNDEASLQYMYALKEEYLIIIDEPKQDFIDAYTELNAFDESNSVLINYRDVQINFLDEVMKPKHRSKPNSISRNNLNIEFFEMDAEITEVNEMASYFIYYIESSEHLYTIMAWTLKNKQDIYREKVKKMIRTFNVKHYN